MLDRHRAYMFRRKWEVNNIPWRLLLLYRMCIGYRKILLFSDFYLGLKIRNLQQLKIVTIAPTHLCDHQIW